MKNQNIEHIIEMKTKLWELIDGIVDNFYSGEEMNLIKDEEELKQIKIGSDFLVSFNPKERYGCICSFQGKKMKCNEYNSFIEYKGENEKYTTSNWGRSCLIRPFVSFAYYVLRAEMYRKRYDERNKKEI